ncbi:MAG: His-Xaa-Ser system radical SAM maturase HxsC [Longimicrobiaceae bacterium]
MISLNRPGLATGIPVTTVGRLVADPCWGGFLVAEPRNLEGARLRDPLRVARDAHPDEGGATGDPHVLVETLEDLEEGDIVALHPSGRIDTLFRIASPNNGLFVTERCNSRCLMCSQPPRMVEDVDYFFALNRTLIPLLPKSLPALGMTGGEPTLLGDYLVRLLELLAVELPQTQIEILSNGRALSRPAITQAIAAASTPRTLFTIPLYSDYGPQHDYIVQARDAFAQTVLGLHNLARFGVRSEIRVVLHRQSVPRLAALARFIHKNLTFVEHVAFMGMEHTGYARIHDDLLWIDPPEYATELESAVEYLDSFGYAVSLYNLQHCLVTPALWPYLRTSISDWKREYLPECEACALRCECGGVFGTSKRQSQLIHAIAREA